MVRGPLIEGMHIANGQGGLSAAVIFGYNGDIGASEETVWDGSALYAYLGAATVLKISSSSTDDDGNPVGTGARTVHIEGLDANYLEISETVTLNGQTAVNTVNEYLRVGRLEVVTVGSGLANAGDVYAGTGTVTGGVPATVYAKIPIGQNNTLMAIYTVPANKQAYLHELFVFSGGTGGQTLTVRLVARGFGGVTHTDHKFKIPAAGGNFRHIHTLYDVFDEKTDIEVRAVASGGSFDLAAHMEFILGSKTTAV